MRTLTFTDDEFDLLVESMHTRAWHAKQHAAGIMRDDGRYMREAKSIAALARKIEKTARAAPKAAFTRGAYSFRPVQHGDAAPYWQVMPVNQRSHLAVKAHLYPASDGMSCVVSIVGAFQDARPSFAEACDLVMARLPIGGA